MSEALSDQALLMLDRFALSAMDGEVVVGADPASAPVHGAMLQLVLAELRQYRKDWDALVELIAETIGNDEEREMASAGEMAEFDPWACLRRQPRDLSAQLQAVTADLAAAREECERLRGERNAALGAPNGCHLGGVLVEAVRRETAAAIASWLEQDSQRRLAEVASGDLDMNEADDAHSFAVVLSATARRIRSAAWRTK